MSKPHISAVLLALALAVSAASAQNPEQPVRVTFRVRYVASQGVYLEGGRSAGLTEGMQLVIKAPAGPADKPSDNPQPVPGAAADSGDSAAPQEPGVVAKLKVVSVAETSAVCEVESSTRPLVVGDVATLPASEVEMLVEKRALSSTRRYPAVVSFTEGDPLDEEARDVVPRPPLPEVNQARGRIGFDYSGLHSAGGSSSSVGVVFRADITRINGTYWNLSGYWRGRIDARSSTVQPTLQDLINRTYHLSLIYDNPNSKWVMGFGRMYIPWASSLDTIDGGYFGRRLSPNTITGFFAGTTPDPTSWNYSLNRRIAGSFINFQGGDYDQVHYSSTFGVGISTLGWKIDRPFVFGENDFSIQHKFAVYHSFELDRPRTQPGVPAVSAGLGRSFLTVRFQLSPRVTIDVNHNYFRDVPTYDPQLVGTGLLDKTLFQGFSVGARVELPKHVTVYTTVGQSSQNGNAKNSMNMMYGVSVGHIWKTGLRADFRFSRFNSQFAQGSYRSFSLSRNFGERFTGEVQAGTQSYVSAFSKDTGSRFLNAHGDFNFGANYFLEGGFTVDRGGPQSYTQWYTMLGYRFDNRRHKKEVRVAPHD